MPEQPDYVMKPSRMVAQPYNCIRFNFALPVYQTLLNDENVSKWHIFARDFMAALVNAVAQRDIDTQVAARILLILLNST